MPAEAVSVHPGPEDTEAEGAGGQEGVEDTAAHLAAGGVFVGEGAEADACVAHAGGGFGEAEEEELVEGVEDQEGQQGGAGDGQELRECGFERGQTGEGGGGLRDWKCADGDCGGSGEAEYDGKDDGGIDGGGHDAQLERCGEEDLGERGAEGSGLLGLDECGGDDRLGVEQDGGPLSGGRGGGRSGGELGRFNFEDAELGGIGVQVGVVAERALGKAGTCAACGDELARELEEVGRDFNRRGNFEEGWGLAEGDLVVEGEAFVAEGIEGGVEVRGGEGLGRRCGGSLVEADGDLVAGGLAGGCCSGRDGFVVNWCEYELGGDGAGCYGAGCYGAGRSCSRRGEREVFRVFLVVVELFEEVELGLGDGAGGDGGDFGGGLSLTNGGLSLCGEELAVALGAGVALSDSGGDFGGSSTSRGGVDGDGSRCWRCGALAAGTMGGEAAGDLLLEAGKFLQGEGGVGWIGGQSRGCGLVFKRQIVDAVVGNVELCGTHGAQKVNLLRGKSFSLYLALRRRARTAWGA